MKLLLDTHVLLWAAAAEGRLPAAGRTLIANEQNELYFSAASLWEIAIKRGLGRPDFQVDRILVAQAMIEGFLLVTADPVLADYPGPIKKV